jgi:hypothetical protein
MEPGNFRQIFANHISGFAQKPAQRPKKWARRALAEEQIAPSRHFPPDGRRTASRIERRQQ